MFLRRVGSRIQQRWVFAVMGCLAIAHTYAVRICLSLAITKMITTKHMPSNDTSSDDTCPDVEATSSNPTSGGIYEWDEYTQGIILSSYYWGYIVTQIPGGVLATKYGGKYVLGVSIFVTGLLSILTPMAVQAYGQTGLIVLRFVVGFGHGATFPAVSILIAHWAPPNERSKITTVVMSGIQVGTIMGSAFSGVLIQNSSTGWPIVFYVFGVSSMLWFFAWIFLGYDHPDAHPFISENEIKYLDETMKEHTHKEIHPTPWRAILSSPPMWALAIGTIGVDWGLFAMITDLPKYMSDVLKFSIQENGVLTALPHIVMLLFSILTSWLADWLIKSSKISTTNVRKILAAISAVGPAFFLLAASYAGCDRTLVVVFFTVGMGLMGAYYPSLIANAFDLSPNHSGNMFAMLGFLVAFTGFAAPYTIGILTPNQTMSEWRIVFWTTFGILITSSLTYVIFGDGEVQHWNDPGHRVQKREEQEMEKHDTEDISMRNLGKPVAGAV